MSFYPHFRTPYSENVNFGLQYQITQDTMIEADYVGSFSRKGIATTDVNAPIQSIMQAQLTNGGIYQSRLCPATGGLP